MFAVVTRRFIRDFLLCCNHAAASYVYELGFQAQHTSYMRNSRRLQIDERAHGGMNSYSIFLTE